MMKKMTNGYRVKRILSLLIVIALVTNVGCSKKETMRNDQMTEATGTTSMNESKNLTASNGSAQSDSVTTETVATTQKSEMSPNTVNSLTDTATASMDLKAGNEMTTLPAPAEPNVVPPSGEGYTEIVENMFQTTDEQPVTTFSIDVDTAGYSNLRRFINGGTMPPVEAVRIEEMLNYFSYDYEEPTGNVPFSINLEQGLCPWQQDDGIVMIGLKGKDIELQDRAKTNLVFLLDVSGSMSDNDKLPLLIESFKLLTNQLTENDRVSIVVYAGSSGVVLDGTRGDQKEVILNALNQLEAGGSTAGSEGILQAYQLAQKYFIENGNNRVILATDGDFNVGLSSLDDLTNLIEEKRNEGIFLSVLGFGQGNTQFSTMELLADQGNGQFAYIDSQKEAEKVMVSQMAGTLYTIAKDVKIQVQFNPDVIASYRLLGYENRLLSNEDFRDDTKDAGEIGAGHTVTALYQVQYTREYRQSNKEEWLADVKLRYKEPTASVSEEIHRVVEGMYGDLNNSDNFQFATAVAQFGLLLRDSQYKGNAAYGNLVNQLARKVNLSDPTRQEFVQMVETVNDWVRAED